MDGGTGSPTSSLGTDKEKHKALYCRRKIAIAKNRVEWAITETWNIAKP